jgi:lipoprotein-anchoring transpeptidase ErfK/SrfK
MGRKTQIAIVVGVLMLACGAAAAYAYDSSQKDEIADGVTVNGVDVGGLDAQQAESRLRRQLISPLRHSLKVTFDGQTWKLPGEKLKVRADLDGAVRQALAVSREGGLPGRLLRYLTGNSVDDQISAEVVYSEPAVNRFVRRVAGDINQEPQDATVNASGSSLDVVPAEPGRKLRDNLLTRRLKAAVLRAGPRGPIVARVHKTAPEVTTDEVAAAYPTYLTLDRANFQLRLWKNLKPAKTYTVAVGQVGLETPAGLYHIQSKQVDPTWNVPDSDWAGDLAGESIPPGPDNPLKARWMGIYSGAGIHGTDDTGSLGTAASHGCVRMAVDDVIDLYDQVDVGTPIYIG